MRPFRDDLFKREEPIKGAQLQKEIHESWIRVKVFKTFVKNSTLIDFALRRIHTFCLFYIRFCRVDSFVGTN